MTFLVLAFLAMVGFSVVLAKVTLTPSPASEELVKSNLRPGRSLRQYAEDYTFLAACKQAGGNLVLGMPFGVLLPILVPRRLRMIRMVLLTVLVIAIVELVQGALVAGRAFDVDDVILNTAGALLGYLLLGRRLSHRYHVLAAGPEPVPEPEPVARDAHETDSRRRPWQGAWAKAGARTKQTKKQTTKPTAKRTTKPTTKPVAKAGANAKPEPVATNKPKAATTAPKPKTQPKPKTGATTSKPKPKPQPKPAAARGKAPRDDKEGTNPGRALLDRFRGR
ncbi:VanZ family protein [Streptomyces sp. NPDC057900]|uniref:VanZ family protein n=1 Tax=Streptomyces sp. NPDC057900 TaxID=3346274 RepID=UPI0036EECEA9